MEILEEKIKEAERFRDGFYVHFPKCTLMEKRRALRERVLPLIQVKFHFMYSSSCGTMLPVIIYSFVLNFTNFLLFH